ncbi:MAG TPA: hypothetical protein VI278_06360 [Nitrososphaeraceae archaeon]
MNRREEKNMTSSNSSKKDSIEVVKECEEAKRRILKEDSHICLKIRLNCTNHLSHNQ